MEKILVAIDALNPCEKAIEFGCYLGRLTKSKVTGVFLEDLVEKESVPGLLVAANGTGFISEEKRGSRAGKTELEQSVSLFKEKCINEEANFQINSVLGIPASELISETRFADVLVMDAEISFNRHYEGSLTEYVKHTLYNSECPVIIAPESFEGVEEIVFAYNGSISSVFAIKQFTYLFPQFHGKKATVVQVNEAGKWSVPERNKITAWLEAHYSDLHFKALEGETDTQLLEYLLKRKGIFIVMGAYGRGALSRAFKRSRADLLIKTTTQPIFIAHR